MPSKLNPYLNFNGNARQVMEFYKSVFGGNLMLSTFKDYNMSSDPSDDNLVMHSQLDAGNDITIMGSDVPKHMGQVTPGNNFGVSLSGDDEAELRRYWDGLADGATIMQPLTPSPWGDTFGMLTDKFGISWLVNIAGKR